MSLYSNNCKSFCHDFQLITKKLFFDKFKYKPDVEDGQFLKYQESIREQLYEELSSSYMNIAICELYFSCFLEKLLAVKFPYVLQKDILSELYDSIDRIFTRVYSQKEDVILESYDELMFKEKVFSIYSSENISFLYRQYVLGLILTLKNEWTNYQIFRDVLSEQVFIRDIFGENKFQKAITIFSIEFILKSSQSNFRVQLDGEYYCLYSDNFLSLLPEKSQSIKNKFKHNRFIYKEELLDYITMLDNFFTHESYSAKYFFQNLKSNNIPKKLMDFSSYKELINPYDPNLKYSLTEYQRNVYRLFYLVYHGLSQFEKHLNDLADEAQLNSEKLMSARLYDKIFK